MAADRTGERELPIALLRELLTYEAATGALLWLPRLGSDWRTRAWNTRFAGKIAGRLTSSGYVQLVIAIDGTRVHTVAHRVIYALEHGEWPEPELDIDHRDRDPAGNRLSNLRIATRLENSRNRRLSKNNTSGRKGVTWCRRSSKWLAQISLTGRNKFLGYFDDLDAATRTYDDAAIKAFGDFASPNRGTSA